MQADMFQCLNGNSRPGRINSHSAAIAMSDRDYIVNIREARENLRSNPLYRVLHGGRDALHGRGNAENVFRPYRSVSITITLKRVTFEAGKRRGDRGGQRQLIKRRSLRQINKFFT